MLDDDGFAIRTEEPKVSSVRPPPAMVEIPVFFDGCGTADEATARMINELGKPFSVMLQGQDAGFRLMFNAMILILANQRGIGP